MVKAATHESRHKFSARGPEQRPCPSSFRLARRPAGAPVTGDRAITAHGTIRYNEILRYSDCLGFPS
jgi:hypothetical protein